MRSSRRFARHRTTALAVVGALGLTGIAISAATASAATAPTESCDSVQDPPAQLPAGVHEGDRLFLSQYRGFIVQITCGRLELVEPTGWDACYFLYGRDVLNYPC